jgi:hypothetical protein
MLGCERGVVLITQIAECDDRKRKPSSRLLSISSDVYRMFTSTSSTKIKAQNLQPEELRQKSGAKTKHGQELVVGNRFIEARKKAELH